MATTWGQFTWGSNTWNSAVNTISVSGQAMSAAITTPKWVNNVGWGSDDWGVENWGSSGLTPSISGIAFTATLNNSGITVTGEINSGWGRLEWGENAWGIAGDVLTAGNSLTGALGTLSITTEINTGWGSDGWGVEGWGASIQVVQPSGLVITAFEGSTGLSFDGDSNLTLSGNSLTATLGEEFAFTLFTQDVTGNAMTMNQTFDPEVVDVTGIAMTAALGDETSAPNTIAEVNAFSVGYWGYKSAWGNFAWGNGTTNTLVMSMLENFSGVDPAPDAEATGNAMAAALASGTSFTIIGNANIQLGTLPMTAALGTAVLDANTLVDVTGVTLQTVQLGSVTVTADGNIFPDGLPLTNTLGTGTNVLIWNAVDTGSAPTTPPGWKEVPTNAA